MQPLSFVLCNYNAPQYFRFCYESIRSNLAPEHEVVLLDDGSTGSEGQEARAWMRSLADPCAVTLENPENVGIAYSYNRAVDAASHELVCVLHTDMYVPPGFDEAMIRGMRGIGGAQEGRGRDFICAYRAEPPLYPPSKDKAREDFGQDPGSFDEAGFLAWNRANTQAHRGVASSSFFFPWMIRRSAFAALGGVDLLFLKYMVDDDDLYLRARLRGLRMAQVMDAAVYHFGSRSSRFAGDNFTQSPSREWSAQYRRSGRNFIRKWGRPPSRFWEEDMSIRALAKYDIGIVACGASLEQLAELEPWCSNVYIDDADLRGEYLAREGRETMLSLAERVRLVFRGEPGNGVVLELDAKRLDIPLVQGLPELLDRMDQPGSYAFGSGTLHVRDLRTLEHGQIVNTRRFAYAPGIQERDFSCP